MNMELFTVIYLSIMIFVTILLGFIWSFRALRTYKSGASPIEKFQESNAFFWQNRFPYNLVYYPKLVIFWGIGLFLGGYSNFSDDLGTLIFLYLGGFIFIIVGVIKLFKNRA